MGRLIVLLFVKISFPNYINFFQIVQYLQPVNLQDIFQKLKELYLNLKEDKSGVFKRLTPTVIEIVMIEIFEEFACHFKDE